MKYVTKQAEPAMFAEWKAKANEEWQPSYEAGPVRNFVCGAKIS